MSAEGRSGGVVATRVVADQEALETFLHARQRELLLFAAELIATPSSNPPGDESEIASLVAERLRALGAGGVSIISAAPGRDSVIGTFVGSGAPGRTLLLNGHLDTKPPGDTDAWLTPPFEPTFFGGKLIGRGSADMKGAIAAMTYGAAAVAHTSTPGAVTVVFTADEEAGAAYGSKWLAERGLLSGDACVIAEPCGVRTNWESIRLVSRGVAIFRISVRGTEMHSSLSDDLAGVSATLKAADLMVKMAEAGTSMLHYEPHPLSQRGPTFNVGLVMQGGVGYGVFPGHAEFLCDVRALPGMTAEQIEADVRSFIRSVEANDPDLRTEFELLNWTPPSQISPDHEIVRALQDASVAVLGESPPLGVFPGGSDAPYFSNVAGIPTVPSFGPGLLTEAHAANESITEESIVTAARIYAIAAARFLSA